MFSNDHARTVNPLRSKTTRCLPAMPPYLLGLCLTALSSSLLADTVTDSFECVLGSESRSIELTFLDNVGAVPCEIRETREDGQSRTLWRADHDVSFCQRQMDIHQSRLSSFGWACLSDTADRPATVSTSLSTRALKSREAESSFIQSSRPNTVPLTNKPVTGALATGSPATISLQGGTPRTVSLRAGIEDAEIAGHSVQIAQPDGEVILFQDRPSSKTKASDKPALPNVSSGELNEDDVREIDDWLMYLSAQSMASIRSIMDDPESFNDYQLTEAQNSDNIYSRLQHRIEFLQSLLKEQ